ncbi:hypothetical protein Sinac_2381 [Singulisphaera acidiphila DSM 18658]|uniref:Uncharacterized protein n=1 Tax=Singulisphaera acidiphila (strain ATCC BAA-1392 / DSM 18658 / VKM B-2454 / MOB10) TaxID=886293 RepID=L0DCX8_SINAD|nr:hypothetical protein Sinac_2381 [Singulisphaera acidiphila DSM 18658]
MKSRHKFCPGVDSLEHRLALSTALASVAQPSNHQAQFDNPTLPGSTGAEVALSAINSSTEKVSLSGTARGVYTSHQSNPDTGTTVQGTAKGRILPLGQTSIVGSFLVPGLLRAGKVEGSMTLKSQRGSVTLNITAPSSISAASSSHYFTYQIVSGTGQFRNAQGSGTVDLTLTPSTSHSGSAHSQHGNGKFVLMFASH